MHSLRILQCVNRLITGRAFDMRFLLYLLGTFLIEIPEHLPCFPVNFLCVSPATACVPLGFPTLSGTIIAVHSLKGVAAHRLYTQTLCTLYVPQRAVYPCGCVEGSHQKKEYHLIHHVEIAVRHNWTRNCRSITPSQCSCHV